MMKKRKSIGEATILGKDFAKSRFELHGTAEVARVAFHNKLKGPQSILFAARRD